jgi:two-component system, sensor histidine kinase YesM
LKNSFFVVLIFVLGSYCATSWAQDTSKVYKKEKSSKLSSKADEVERLLKKGAEPKVIAQKYEEIGRDFKRNNQNNKAIQYYNNAVEYYNKAKLKDDAARILREIAQMQEQKENLQEAAAAYEMSATMSNSAVSRNDAARVQAPSTESKILYNQQNIDSYNSASADDFVEAEKALAYQTQAKLLQEVGKKEEALNFSKEALQILENKKNGAPTAEVQRMKIEVSSQIAELYNNTNQFDQALNTALDTRQLALQSGDLSMIVTSTSDLADLYRQNQEPDNALLVLKDTYRMALQSGRTLDARSALIALVKHFDVEEDFDAQLFFYQDFIGQLETLIARDSSMLDEKIFYAKEERIEQLEKERALQDELLDQSRNFNYGLVAFFVALFLAAAFLFWSLMKVRMQNKRIALQSLRREMNPHFVFNSLNSVNRFIAQNDEIKANNYLTSYAQLMRTTMEISSQDFIRLDKEIELLTKYLDLEHLRFSQHFDYRIELDENVELENCSIPGFLIQPHLENAIWHGLRYKKEKGLLLLKIAQEKGQIVVAIEDNGIGIQESQQLKTENQKSHVSRGFLNIKERIELLNSLYKFKIEMRILSPTKDNMGTTVLLILPKTVKNG